MVNALNEAQRLKFDCVQVFTKNQRQWHVPAMRAEDRDAWLTQLHAMKWDIRSGPARVVSHASYLINLASPNAKTWKQSLALFQEELERCDALKISLCVVHPGAHLGEVPPRRDPMAVGGEFTVDEQRGMQRITNALDIIHARIPGARAVTCLETTVGAGTTLGWSFEQLAFLRANVRDPERVAFCLDTCHVTAAGYDMTTPSKAQRVLRHLGKVCGMKHVRALHMNDSMFPVGSRRDRHAHIGDGDCGKSCFTAILRARALQRVPMILETPKDDGPDGTPWDVTNVRRLKRLARTPAASR